MKLKIKTLNQKESFMKASLYLLFFIPLIFSFIIAAQKCTCCNCKCQCNKQKNNQSDTKNVVQEAYTKAAQQNCSCKVGCKCKTSNADIAQYLGYSEDEINALADANLGLGCGNPVKLSDIKKGETVLDLGSGAGFDCLLAAKKSGPTGKVIGIDFTEAMIKKAQENAQKYNIKNVQFIQADIENLPIETASIDIILSNCTINLAPNKDNVFKEAMRVLKPHGRMYLSDIVLLKEITPQQRADAALIAGCVGGALLKEEYIKKIEKIGFKTKILGEDTEIRKRFYNDLPVVSLKLLVSK